MSHKKYLYQIGNIVCAVPRRRDWEHEGPGYIDDMRFAEGEIVGRDNSEGYNEYEVWVDGDSYWYMENWIRPKKTLMDDLLDVVSVKKKKRKKVRVVGFKMGNKIIGIIKREK